MNKWWLPILLSIPSLSLVAMEEKTIIAQGDNYTLYSEKSGKRIFEAKSFEPNFHVKIYNTLVGSRPDIFFDKQKKHYDYFQRYHPETPAYIITETDYYKVFIDKEVDSQGNCTPNPSFVITVDQKKEPTKYREARERVWSVTGALMWRGCYPTWQDKTGE